MEDTTYKMPLPRHDDEFDSNDEVLVKRIKKIKQASKSRPNQMQVRSKKFAKAHTDKQRQVVQKSPNSPVKHGQLLVLQHEQQYKSPRQHTSTTILAQDPTYMQSMPKP